MGGVDLEKIVDAKVMVTPSCAKKATTKKGSHHLPSKLQKH